MADCTRTGNDEWTDADWTYVGAFVPDPAHQIGGGFINYVVYVWKRNFKREYLCKCRAKEATVWVEGNTAYFKATEYFDGHVLAGVPKKPSVTLPEEVLNGEPAIDPDRSIPAKSTPQIDGLDQIDLWAPGKSPDPAAGLSSLIDGNAVTLVLVKPVPKAICGDTDMIQLPDGKKIPWPVTPPPPPPRPPGPDHADEDLSPELANCCKRHGKELPTIKLVKVAFVRDSSGQFFSAEIEISHPCGLKQSWSEETLLTPGGFFPLHPPLSPSRAKEATSVDGTTTTYTWNHQQIALKKPHGVELRFVAYSKCPHAKPLITSLRLQAS